MNNKKVLLVEDDDFLRQLVGSKLTDDGFALNVAVDSVGVFTLLEKEKPDLILLDVMLPGLDGFQILEKIKSDKSNEAIPVVILSNLGQKEDKDKEKGLKYEYKTNTNIAIGEFKNELILRAFWLTVF